MSITQCGNIGEPPFVLAAADLRLRRDRAALIEADQMEGVLSDIDADRRDLSLHRLA